jgi:hypothetical protein
VRVRAGGGGREGLPCPQPPCPHTHPANTVHSPPPPPPHIHHTPVSTHRRVRVEVLESAPQAPVVSALKCSLGGLHFWWQSGPRHTDCVVVRLAAYVRTRHTHMHTGCHPHTSHSNNAPTRAARPIHPYLQSQRSRHRGHDENYAQVPGCRSPSKPARNTRVVEAAHEVVEGCLVPTQERGFEVTHSWGWWGLLHPTSRRLQGGPHRCQERLPLVCAGRLP